MNARKVLLIVAVSLALAACDKYGGTGAIQHALGNWASVNLPAGCVAKQIAAEEHGGVVVLCEDGRIFH